MFSTEGTEFESTQVAPLAKEVVVTIGEKKLTLSQQLKPVDLAPLFSDEWTGSQVWNCSVVLAEYITREANAGRMLLDGAGVVELGSGCGLCSIYACLLGSTVVATDQGSMVSLISRNAAANIPTSAAHRFEAAELLWGDEKQTATLSDKLKKPVDIILVSDCLNPIYGEESYGNLAHTILSLCEDAQRTDAQVTVCLAYEHRDGGGAESAALLKTFFGFFQNRMSVRLGHREGDIDIYIIEPQVQGAETEEARTNVTTVESSSIPLATPPATA